MVYGLWHSAAGLQAQEYRQAVITNNLANAGTPGFKPERVAFQERLVEVLSGGAARLGHRALDGMTGGLFEREPYTNFEPGPIEPSTSPLDVAILGDGFLTVQTGAGPAFTRDGRLVVGKNGALLHAASGAAVVNEGGAPIFLDAESPEAIRIDPLGFVRQGDDVAGRLAVVDFSNRQALRKTGENLLDAGGQTAAAADGQVRQYAYEGSGVDPISTLVDMIAATRAYELNATMISMQDETIGRVVSEVGRIA